jgi:hypothetical protein
MFSPQSIEPTGQSYNRFRMVVDRSTNQEDLTNSKLYSHLVKDLRSKTKNIFKFGDIIEVLAEDGSFFAELLVVGCNGYELFTRLNYYKNHDEKAEKFETADYEAVWKGPKIKWALVRKEDNSIFKSQLNSREECMAFLKNLPR